MAARGLDVPEVDLVICCQPPSDYESYIHRSGRTGRAGRTGVCVCFYKAQETNALATLEYKTVSVYPGFALSLSKKHSRFKGIKFKRVGAPGSAEVSFKIK